MKLFNSKEDFINYINSIYTADFVNEILTTRDFINGNVYTTYYINIKNNYRFLESKANYVFNNIWNK